MFSWLIVFAQKPSSIYTSIHKKKWFIWKLDEKERNKMYKIKFAAILFICAIGLASSANILAIFPLASPSHYLWVSPLVVALANKGHNVTVLSPNAEKKPVPNLTNILIEGIYELLGETYNYAEMADKSEIYWAKETFVFFEVMCTHALHCNGFKQLLNYPADTKYDLIIMDGIGVECLMGIRQKFGNPPIVVVNSLSISPWIFELTGTPNNPSHIPYYYLAYTDNMKFTERLYNFILTTYTHFLYQYDYLPNMERESKKFFGPQTSSVYETMKNISVGLANYHPSFNYPWPTTPNLIPVGGLQVKDPKPLPADIQKFLDDATEGAIFFSLGTNVRSDKLTPEKRQAILDAFSELPQRVLWKFESDLQQVPQNVKIGKFFPQNDILAHPNIKLFVTHAGMLSTHETIIRKVPVVGIPFLVDQHTNIRKLAHFGCGLLLEYRDLTKDTFLRAIREVIGNSSYRENIRQLSSRFQDNPQTPLERAVFWSEYVIRHKGAPHLQSAAKNLNFIQYFLLDVIAFLLVVPIVIVSVLCCLCCRRKTKVTSKQKKN